MEKNYYSSDEDKHKTHIEIPNGYTSVGEGAFKDCYNLKTITISKSVTSIRKGAFCCCSNLQSVSLPEGLTFIGEGAFCGCSNLQSISLPKSITSISAYAFSDCSILQSMSIPNSVTSIEKGAFCGCSRLRSISIPKSVTFIGSYAFFNCLSLQYISLPEGLTSIGEGAFYGCSNLRFVRLPESLTSIGYRTFYRCWNLQSVFIPKGVSSVNEFAFDGRSSLKNIVLENGIKCININAFSDVDIKYIYFDKKNHNIILSTQKDPELEKKCLRKDFTAENYYLAMNQNYKDNFIQLSNWKEEKKIKFIPPEFTLKILPSGEMPKYFINKNHLRWKKLVETLGFDKLENSEKNNFLPDLMKIYYAIGGFSESQGESEKAYEYILNHVAVSKNPNATPQEIGQEIHSRFSRLTLNGEYCKEFAQFFMKYYKTNPDFMNFSLKDNAGELMDSTDYLCYAHNSFKTILKNYPNRVVNGNEKRALLTPRFVAEHCSIVEYVDVQEGNELLAETVGKYGYDQRQFNHIQEIYDRAKKIKDVHFIEADKSLGTNGICFRILEKDDPLGFVIGDITNCCQHIGGNGESCVVDGYTNPEAGFIVFEEHLTNENGNPIDKTRILGQAYVWYDSKTKTVCLDNIEIPHKVSSELNNKAKKEKGLSIENLISAVKECAEAIIRKMNEKEVKVERVTIGQEYNCLNQGISQHFKKVTNPKTQNREGIYTDAGKVQYIIATYDQLKKERSCKTQPGSKTLQHIVSQPIPNQNRIISENALER